MRLTVQLLTRKSSVLALWWQEIEQISCFPRPFGCETSCKVHTYSPQTRYSYFQLLVRNSITTVFLHYLLDPSKHWTLWVCHNLRWPIFFHHCFMKFACVLILITKKTVHTQAVFSHFQSESIQRLSQTETTNELGPLHLVSPVVGVSSVDDLLICWVLHAWDTACLSHTHELKERMSWSLVLLVKLCFPFSERLDPREYQVLSPYWPIGMTPDSFWLLSNLIWLRFNPGLGPCINCREGLPPTCLNLCCSEDWACYFPPVLDTKYKICRLFWILLCFADRIGEMLLQFLFTNSYLCCSGFNFDNWDCWRNISTCCLPLSDSFCVFAL